MQAIQDKEQTKIKGKKRTQELRYRLPAIIVSDHNFVKKYYLLQCPALKYTIFEEGKNPECLIQETLLGHPLTLSQLFLYVFMNQIEATIDHEAVPSAVLTS